MVRTYKRKTNRNSINEALMNLAIDEVVTNNLSISNSAKKHGISRTTLRDRIKKLNKNQQPENAEECSDKTKPKYQSKYASQQIFTEEKEKEISEYFLICSNLQHGLTYCAARKFVFEYASLNHIAMPPSWETNQTAGIDWIKGFMKRNKDLSLRKPENTSLARLTAFTKDEVMKFFDNMQVLYTKYSFGPGDIYNLDETGITTVLPSPKVIALKGKRTVSQAVSAERGSLVTMVGIINAAGNALPPVYVFPRIKYKEHFVNGGPNGCIGISEKSGWMTKEGFMTVLNHIKNHTRCSQERPIMLFLDNHISHCSLEAIIFCRDNGIHMITFPPHTSHKLQPLDVSVFGPFKKYLATSFHDFEVSHPGRYITIYDIPSLSNIPFQKAFVCENICKGFSSTGVSPFNRQVFPESDFITISSQHQTADTVNCTIQDDSSVSIQDNTSLESGALQSSGAGRTPEQVRPVPKLQRRLQSKRKGTSTILTSTPSKKDKEKTTIQKPKAMKPCKKKPVSKRNIKTRISTSSDESVAISYADTYKSTGSFEENKYVLVRYDGKVERFFVGRIISNCNNSITVDFLRKKSNSWIFYEPEIKDVSYVLENNIVMKLPEPKHPPGTSRSAATYIFDVDLNQFNVM